MGENIKKWKRKVEFSEAGALLCIKQLHAGRVVVVFCVNLFTADVLCLAFNENYLSQDKNVKSEVKAAIKLRREALLLYSLIAVTS